MRAVIVIILTVISVAATAGCSSEPEPVYIVVTPNTGATVEAGTSAIRQVEDAVSATVEANREDIVREATANPTSTSEPPQQRYPQPTSALASTSLERGIALAKNGDYLDALNELKKAQRLHGGRSEEAEVWLSRVQGALGNPEAALRHQQNAKALREGTGQPETNQPVATLVPTPDTETKAVMVQTEPTPTSRPAPTIQPTQSPASTIRPAPTSTPIPTPRVAPTTAPTSTPAPTPTILIIKPAPTTAPTRTPAPTPTILVIQRPTPTRTPISIPVRAPARGADSKLTKLTDLQNAKWLSQSKPEIAEKMASLPWASDGLSETEEKIIEQLLYLYVKNSTPTAVSLMNMPFLQSVNPGDLQAVTSLRMVSQENGPTAFQQIVNHPTFSSGGITDEWTPVVTTLESVQDYNQSLTDILLDQSQVNLEARNIQTPLRGAVALNIVRIGAERDPQSMDRLENAVRSAEDFMGEPLPTDMVVVLYADAVRGNNAGHNSGTSIAILPKYDSATEKGAQEINDHEVAHYYWGGNQNWIDEGMATFTADLLQARRTGTRILPGKPPCPEYRTISQLSTRDDTHRCDYSLGERLFTDLHDALGTTEFREGMSALYRESTVEDNADNLQGTKLGISHIKAAFTSTAAKEIINRWYHGTAPYRTDLYDRDPVDPKLSVLNASITEATLKINDAPVASFSARSNRQEVSLGIQYGHPTPVGKAGQIPVIFVIFYQDGFPYFVEEYAIHAKPGYIGGGVWYDIWQLGQPLMAPGEYVAYVYEAGNKVAQVHWTVTP